MNDTTESQEEDDTDETPLEEDVVEETCDQPGPLGVCSVCSDDGRITAPISDPACPAIDCGDVDGVEQIEDEFGWACATLESDLPANACAGIDQCLAEEDYCDSRTSQVQFRIFRHSCLEMVECGVDVQASTTSKSVDSPCVVTTENRIDRLRLRVIDATEVVELSGVELGQLHSDGQVDFPQFAIASVMADESDVEALLQGNTNVELIQDSVLEIAFSSPVPVSLLKTEVSVAAPSRITVEVKTGDDAWTEWETSTLAAGQVSTLFMPRGVCNESAECITQSQFDCGGIADTLNLGPVCEESTDPNNSFCEFFVPNNGQERSCDDVCETAGLTCISVQGDRDNDCRPKNTKNCDDRMNDFICRCGP